MSASREDLYQEAMGLDPKERADLIAMLLASLDDGADEGVEAAWLEEVEKRLEALESGRTQPIPWSEARSRIFSRSAG